MTQSPCRAALGYDPFESDREPDRIVDQRIDKRGDSLRGKVDIRNGTSTQGSRELTSRDCEELVSSLSVTIAR